MTTAVELQFTEAGALAVYVQSLITGGATDVRVTPTVKSWYLIIHNG